jgi:hypothetical protein
VWGNFIKINFMETKVKTKQDLIIEYLMNSKRELHREIKNDVHTKEFQDAVARLKEKNKKLFLNAI